MSDATEVQKVVDLINDVKIAMLTTTNDSDQLVSRPLVVQQIETDGDMWFFTPEDTSQVADVNRDARVNVSFSRRGAWVSVSGEAEIVKDRAKAEQLWNPMADAWFPDGPNTPGLVFLRVDADSAEYWASQGGPVSTAISFIKAKATGRRPDAGESRTVEL